jgi:ABC-type multidrug transport system fused ATPase/permease subunit
MVFELRAPKVYCNYLLPNVKPPTIAWRGSFKHKRRLTRRCLSLSMNGFCQSELIIWSFFLEQSQSILKQSQQPFYMLFCIQQWLALVLDLVVGAIAIILIGITTLSKGSLSATSIGVALNLILTFNQSHTQAIKSWTMLETSIGAVSRVQNFVQNTPSENNRRSSSQPVPGHDRPSRGAIRFESVTAGYR